MTRYALRPAALAALTLASTAVIHAATGAPALTEPRLENPANVARSAWPAAARRAPDAVPATPPATTGTRAGALCGDGILDAGEGCDDANTNDGDGCSATCAVEDGFFCTLPVPPGTGTNVVQDPSFEAGSPSPFWNEASVNFSTPICDPVSCGPSAAFDGTWWVWFGGSAVPETASVDQDVTIPVTAGQLSFRLRVPACDSNADFMSVTMDGNEVYRLDPCATTATYLQQTASIAAFADGSVHKLRFEASTFSVNGGNSNLFLDLIQLSDGGGPGEPSVCTEQCYEETFDDGLGNGDLSGWTRFNTGALDLDWGLTDDGVCWSGTIMQTPADNVTGGTQQAACIDSDQPGQTEINDSYLCSPMIDLNNATDPELSFRYNYQIFEVPDLNDVFEVLVGALPPSAGNIASYTSVFSRSTSAGTFIGLPGVEETIPLTPAEGYVCFRYAANFDWYAQVDDVRILAARCDAPADADADGVPDASDNCTLAANPVQTDTDGDGIGNACDGDFNQDCAVNFLDLGVQKGDFFGPDSGVGTDMNGDGNVNFLDLGLLKDGFFQPPGPSGIPSVCP